MSDRISEIEDRLAASESTAYVIDDQTAADMRWLIQAHYRLQSRIAYLEGRLEDEGDTYARECPDADPS